MRIFPLLALAIITFSFSVSAENEPIPAYQINPHALIASGQPSTTSAFISEHTEEVEIVPFETIFVDVSSWEVGVNKTIQTGVNGTTTTIFLVEKYDDTEISRQVVSKEIQDPTPQIIQRGIKPIEILTAQGPFTYTKKATVWATSYDGNCLGCSGITYTGTKVKHGVCAVDPTYIPLGTVFYVQGYGMCLAADIGGEIVGAEVDLGFASIKDGWWSSRMTDIFLP